MSSTNGGNETPQGPVTNHGPIPAQSQPSNSGPQPPPGMNVEAQHGGYGSPHGNGGFSFASHTPPSAQPPPQPPFGANMPQQNWPQPPPGHNLPPQPSRPKNSGVGAAWIIIGITTVAMLLAGGVAVGASVFVWGDDATGALRSADNDDDGGNGSENEQPTSNGSLTYGDGAYTVDYYYDFACPPCGESMSELAPLLEEGIGNGAFTIVMHPVEVVERSDQYGVRAAAASVCAAQEGQDAFFEFTQAAMAKIPPKSGTASAKSDLTKLVDFGGEFSACVDNDTYTEQVKQATADALANGLKQVPSVTIDSNEQQPQDVKPKLQALIASAD